jgi:ATP-dependent exoDNAse (exonuclease V) beta subunit
VSSTLTDTPAIRHPPTPEQERAIEARESDVFLEAGAGTGKTTVLVDRYCEAVREDGVDVARILAFTFTERAAAELRSGVRRRLGEHARAAADAGERERSAELWEHARATERAWVMTIHGFCRRLLATHPVAAGLDPRFRVLDEAEAARLRDRAFLDALGGLLEAGHADVARAAASYRPWRLSLMTIGVHERLRSQGMAEPRLPAVADPVRSTNGNGEAEPLTPAEMAAARAMRAGLEALLEAFHRRYEELKAERSGLDFADLELRAVALLRSSPAVSEIWRGRFDHVMVDEFQDTNRVQLDLVAELRGPETRVFVVGDENQSIYRFRNADLEVFREQKRRAEDDAGTEVMPLLGNFRSLRPVLAAANEIGGTLLPGFQRLVEARAGDDPRSVRASAGGGGSVELLLTYDEGRARDALSWRAEGIELGPPQSETIPELVAEARFLARRLRELVDRGEAARGDIVVLLRAFTHVDAHEEALARAGLEPYVVGGRGYWSQQQVEDLVRLLGVVSNPLDDELLFGALASPAVEVSPDALWLLRAALGEGERHVWPLVEWRFGGGERGRGEVEERWLVEIPEEDEGRLRRFCGTLAGLRAEAPVVSLEELLERTMSAFGYDLALLARRGGAGRMANVRKLMRLAREFESHEGRDLAGFLAAAAESARRDEREGMAAMRAEEHDGVRVMTVHAAKGLQFPVVAVPDLARSLIAGPSWRDVVIGRLGPDGEARFGMRLVFPSAKSFGLWELAPLSAEESADDAEEGCRLVYVAATRAEDRLILSGCFKPSDLEAAEGKPGESPLRRLLPALAQRGWEGGDGELALPAPPLATGEGAEGATVPLRIEVSRPSPERAEWLREALPPPEATADDGEPERPPLLDGRPSRTPAGHLSYSALAEYERCGYRFYVERVLGLRAGAASAVPTEAGDGDREPGGTRAEADELVEPEASEAEEAAEPPALDPRSRPLGFGNAVHAALEWSAREGWREPGRKLLAALLAREGLEDAESLTRAAEMVSAWRDSPIHGRVAAMTTRPEVPFVLDLGGTVVRGKIDLLATGSGEVCVIDFKTDLLRGRAPEELGERYGAQRQLYALAAAGAGESDRVSAVHVFLEDPSRPVAEEFDGAALAAAREHLESLIGRIREGEFEPTSEPYAAVCFGCPAAARLCPVAAWRPSSAAGAPAATMPSQQLEMI